MENKSWREQKDEIFLLIKKISDCYGGDNLEWLKNYAKEVVQNNKDHLKVALDCFLDLERQIDEKPYKI